MSEKLCRTAHALALTLLLAGCAIYPVVQVAGGAMTGYDAAIMADDYIPRDRVAGGEICGNTDKMLERRLRERLQLNNIHASAHVIDRQAYLIGQFPNRTGADQAIAIAKGLQGITVINCKFYPMVSPREARDDTVLLATLNRRLGETKRLHDADLRVEVIRSNAILIGAACDYGQKTAAVAIASEVGGIREIVDYIVVKIPAQPATAGNKVARN